METARLAALAAQLGESPAAVARTLRSELDQAIAAIDAGLRAGDHPTVRDAVHAARNSALMVDDGAMLTALKAIGTAAAAGERTGADAARAALTEPWARLRAQLCAAGG